MRFSTARLPTYMNITVLAPQLVKGGTLDCPTLLQGLDAGTLNPTDSTVVNPLVVAYQRSVTITSKADVEKFPTSEAASGPGRVLLLDAYLSTAAPDGGDQFLGRACAVFDNSGGDAGTVGITVAGP